MPFNAAAALRVLFFLSFAAAPLAARAQTTSPTCKLVLDAKTKEITTPHHAYQTETNPAKDAPGTSGEVISTATGSFVLYKGKWTKIGITPQDNLAQMKENLRDTKVYECQRQPDASIAGVAMLVYTAHSENDMAKTDARLWVAKNTGLIYREDTDLDTGDAGGKRHVSMRFDYTNVEPPPGMK